MLQKGYKMGNAKLFLDKKFNQKQKKVYYRKVELSDEDKRDIEKLERKNNFGVRNKVGRE